MFQHFFSSCFRSTDDQETLNRKLLFSNETFLCFLVTVEIIAPDGAGPELQNILHFHHDFLGGSRVGLKCVNLQRERRWRRRFDEGGRR